MQEDNYFIELEQTSTSQATLPQPKTVKAGRAVDWIKTAIKDFLKSPGHLLLVGIIAIVFNLILYCLGSFGNILSMIISPIIIVVVLMQVILVETGKNVNYNLIIEPFKETNLWLVGLLSFVVIFAIGILISILFMIVAFSTGLSVFSLISSPFGIPYQSQLITLSIIAVIFGILLLLVLFTISFLLCFAPILVHSHKASAVDAIVLSIKAVMKNIWPFTLFGIIVAVAFVLFGAICTALFFIPYLGKIILVIIVIACIPAFFALYPIATSFYYQAYKDIFSIE